MTKPGYKLDRDGRGLTAREREVLEELKTGASVVEIAGRVGITKQRVSSITTSLIRKGYLLRTDNGGLAVVVK